MFPYLLRFSVFTFGGIRHTLHGLSPFPVRLFLNALLLNLEGFTLFMAMLPNKVTLFVYQIPSPW